MIARGDVCWADLGPERGSGPGRRRPVLVVQSDLYNDSLLATTVVAVITSNTALASRPGNVFLPSSSGPLERDSVVNVTGLQSIDRRFVDHPLGTIPPHLLDEVDAGLRRVLSL